jgi:hypothetical protein
MSSFRLRARGVWDLEQVKTGWSSIAVLLTGLEELLGESVATTSILFQENRVDLT